MGLAVAPGTRQVAVGIQGLIRIAFAITVLCGRHSRFGICNAGPRGSRVFAIGLETGNSGATGPYSERFQRQRLGNVR